jgi:uncharacterized RDD family membrane protein YckC
LGVVALPFSDQPPEPDVAPPHHLLGALPRRIGAFFIDAVILGILGNLIGMLFFDYFSRLGSFGALLGFFLALPYFAIFNSDIGNGQTPGKRLLRLQVVDKDGKTIPFERSVLRYSVFALPCCISEMALPVAGTPWFIPTLLYLIVYGVGGANLYLVFFNRHTRQGLHDLVAESYVADFGGTGPLRISPIWKAHWIFVSSLLVLVVGGQILERRWSSYSQMVADLRLLEGVKGVQSAGVQHMTSWNHGEKKESLVVNIRWTGESSDESAFAAQIARIVLENDPTAKDRDTLRVNMIRGYNLGIANGQISRPYEHSPAEWSSLLFGTDSAPIPASQ